MGFTCGIVGLPNVGKSTLFNAITAAGVDAANYPFCTIDPNVGIVAVPDERLDVLGGIFRPSALVPTTIEFVDIAGLVKGASRGEGLGNQFLAHIREVDAIIHVVRCFDDPNVVHVDGSINPQRDIEVVEAELLLKDLETLEQRLAEVQRKAKAGDKKARVEAEFHFELRGHLLAGRPARTFSVEGDDKGVWLRDLHLLTGKPVLYVCNINERDVGVSTPLVSTVERIAASEGARMVVASAEVEAEVAELPAAERRGFLQGLGLKESGLDKVIHEGYGLLHLITFFTGGAKEVRARTLRRGETAYDAAGLVHSDFQRGFIRAEVMKYGDLARLGSEHALRERGMIHVHGKEYVVEDGDVIYFRFNV